MRTPRCHVDMPLSINSEITLPENAARHLRQVLRMRSGDEVKLFNGLDGRDYLARLSELGKQAVRAIIVSAGSKEADVAISIHLAIGLSKGTRMDFALQKAVELGVVSISPLLTEHTVVRLPEERMAKRMQHWQGIIIHACEQSGRRYIPALNPCMNYRQWLQQNAYPGILLDPAAQANLPDLPRPTTPVCIVVGPEGGLSEQEIDRARDHGLIGIRLGPRILRTETAPLAAIAAMQACWGDYR